MAALFRSPQGKQLSIDHGQKDRDFWETVLHVDSSRASHYTEQDGRREERASFWSIHDPIWVDEAFSKMMVAAANSAPVDQGIAAEELIAPSGIMFFEQMLDESFGQAFANGYIRALTWMTVSNDHGEPAAIYVNTWHETNSREDPYLWRHRIACFGFKQTYTAEDISDQSTLSLTETMFHLRLLRALGAISRTTYAVDDEEQVSVQIAASKRRNKTHSRQRLARVRRLYLRHPEYGAAELNAAHGTPHRLHWVRGHWREQWYASTEEHRTIWIEGHPRGNRELGVVEGDRVMIAKGDPS